MIYDATIPCSATVYFDATRRLAGFFPPYPLNYSLSASAEKEAIVGKRPLSPVDKWWCGSVECAYEHGSSPYRIISEGSNAAPEALTQSIGS